MNIKPFKMVTAFSAVAMLTGCSGSHDGEPEPPVMPAQVPLCIVPSHAEVTSRAALESVYTDFAVYTWKKVTDDDIQDVLRHADGTPYRVEFLSGKWTYEFPSETPPQYLRYWDRAAAQYTFNAYAPYSIDDTPVASTYDITVNRDGVTIGSVPGNVSPYATVNWVVAKHRRDNALNPGEQVSDYDLIADPSASTPLVNPASLTADVSPVFHYIYSSITFRAYIGEGLSVKVTSFKVTLNSDITTLADYTDGAWTSPAASTNIIADLEGLSIPVEGTTAAESAVIRSLYEIPQNISGVKITIELRTDNGNVLEGTFDLTEGWQREKNYIYYLKLSTVSNKIIMDFTVDDWEQGDDIEVEEPVTNW